MTVLADPKDGDRIDALDTFYPTELRVVGVSGFTEKDPTVTTYGYVLKGGATIVRPGINAGLGVGAYFCIPGGFKVLTAPDSLVVLIRRLGYRGQLTVGAIEQIGRLSYIDGCSDSILVYPPRMGDPCLNYLHFPPGVWQTQHTHPTIRAGIVARGSGKAFRTPDRDSKTGWEVDLTEGCVFLLPQQEQHSFRTVETDCEMDVIAFHPDSDFGPTDFNQPMLNRTYIEHGKKR